MRRGREGASRRLATIRPEAAFSPGPGCVLAPMCQSASTGVRVRAQAGQRPPRQRLVERASSRRTMSPRCEVDVARLEVRGREIVRASTALGEVRRVRGDAATTRSAYARRAPRSTRRPDVDLARRVARGAYGTSCSWIQRTACPSGARVGSTRAGWPVTTVGAAGQQPGERLGAGELDGVGPVLHVDDGGAVETVVAPAQRLGQREVDLHRAAAVAEPRGLVGRGVQPRRRAPSSRRP